MEMTVKSARLISGKTQREMAQEMGISRDTYMAIERQPERATISQAKQISQITGVQVDRVFFG